LQRPPDERRPEERETAGPVSARAANARQPESRPPFPYNSVVGIVDDPLQLEAAVQALLAGGFAEAQVRVLAGAAGTSSTTTPAGRARDLAP